MNIALPPKDERLLARLNKHPQSCGRVEPLVTLLQDAGDELRKADEVEWRAIDDVVRRLRQDLLEVWANEQVLALGLFYRRNPRRFAKRLAGNLSLIGLVE